MPGGRWNALLDAVSTWANPADDCVSCRDNDRYEDSRVNWRVREGYGQLFAALAEISSRPRTAPMRRVLTPPPSSLKR